MKSRPSPKDDKENLKVSQITYMPTCMEAKNISDHISRLLEEMSSPTSSRKTIEKFTAGSFSL